MVLFKWFHLFDQFCKASVLPVVSLSYDCHQVVLGALNLSYPCGNLFPYMQSDVLPFSLQAHSRVLVTHLQEGSVLLVTSSSVLGGLLLGPSKACSSPPTSPVPQPLLAPRPSQQWCPLLGIWDCSHAEAECVPGAGFGIAEPPEVAVSLSSSPCRSL